MNPFSEPSVFSTLPPNVMACLVDKLSLQSVARLGITCKELNIGTIKALKRLKLVKEVFYSELQNAFISRRPVTLKLRYFSFEARKKPNFDLKNTDEESLKKIRSSKNIKLLLDKKIIEQKDLNVLFDEDLKILEFLYEKSQKTCVELFDEIPDTEHASYLCRYIIKDKLSFTEAIDLTPAEVANLANRYICYFVITAEMDINQAKNLSRLQFSVLSNKKIISLITYKKLTVKEALVMNEDAFSRLNNELIYAVVVRGELRFDEVNALTGDQVANATRIGVPECSYSEPYVTFRVLRALGISVGDILAIDYDQMVRLSRHPIHKLLRAKKLSIEKALSLTATQADLFGCRLLGKLFLADKLSLEEAEKLSDDERRMLNSSAVCKLIARGKVRFDDAVNPDREEAMDKLCRLWEFICEDKVSVEFVERLSEEQLKLFESEWVRDLIWGEVCKVDDLVDPNCEEILRKIDNEWICKLLTYHRNLLSIENIAALSDEQVRKFDSQWIYRLVIEGLLSVDDVVNLSEDAVDHLNNARIVAIRSPSNNSKQDL